MRRRFLFALLLAFTFGLAGFTAALVPRLRAVANFIFEPGYAPIKWIAGGEVLLHDLLPILLVVLLNVAFYTVVFWALLQIVAYMKSKRE